MASDPSAPNPEKGGLQSMLDRLKGLTRSLSGDEPEEEILPTFDLPTPAAAPTPVEPLQAIPVEPLPEETAPETVPPPTETAPPAEPPPSAEAPPPTRCPVCNSERLPGHAICVDCGFHFPGEVPQAASARTPGTAVRIKQRYELGELLSER